MSTTTLSPPTGAMPRFKIEVFNTMFASEDAVAEGADVDIDYDITHLGWMIINDMDIWLQSFAYEEEIDRCPCGELVVEYEDLWMFGLEPLYKPRAGLFFDGNQGGPENEQTGDSRVIICVDNSGMGEDDSPVGEVWVYGVYEEALEGGGYEPHYFTEFVPVNGPGCYPTVNAFTRVANMACDFPDGSGSHSTVSLWGKAGTTIGRRECRIWTDANGDGVYGLVFAGYIYVSDIRPTFGGRRQVALKLEGYQSFLQCNDYACGYRCGYRCLNYQKTGESGTCAVNSTSFRSSAGSCFIGDLGVCHPDGTLASTRCPDYNKSTEVLPFDGWTYYKDYAPTTETGYEYCPKNYFRALQAACNMANSYEIGRAVSRPWTLQDAFSAPLAAAVTREDMYIYVDRQWMYFDVPEVSFIVIGNEIMRVNDIGGSTEIPGATKIDVLRGPGYGIASDHSKGDIVHVPVVAMSPDGFNLNQLCVENRLSVPDLKSSMSSTLDAMASTVTIEVNDAAYMAWSDKFKQIHLSEFNMDSTGDDGTGGGAVLQLREIDFVDEPRVSYSNVVNQISARIMLVDGNSITATLKAEDIGITGYDLSVKYFGRVAVEETNPQLNSYGPVEEKVDFLTWAKNYLKLRAFPVYMQEVCVFGFVPDEHYWEDMAAIRKSENDEYVKPYLQYTDAPNKHIDIRGTKVSCPDYSLPIVDGEYQMSNFVVHGVKTTFSPPGELKTYLCLCRYTGPSDFDTSYQGAVPNDVD